MGFEAMGHAGDFSGEIVRHGFTKDAADSAYLIYRSTITFQRSGTPLSDCGIAAIRVRMHLGADLY